MRTQSKPLLVVAKNAINIAVHTKKNVIYIADINRVFPAIHEHQPTGIVLDHDFLGANTEKILRRLTANPFYSKIKIYCYKSHPHTKIDGLLVALGVHEFIYPQVAYAKKTGIASKLFSYVVDGVVTRNLTEATN